MVCLGSCLSAKQAILFAITINYKYKEGLHWLREIIFPTPRVFPPKKSEISIQLWICRPLYPTGKIICRPQAYSRLTLLLDKDSVCNDVKLSPHLTPNVYNEASLPLIHVEAYTVIDCAVSPFFNHCWPPILIQRWNGTFCPVSSPLPTGKNPGLIKSTRRNPLFT